MRTWDYTKCIISGLFKLIVHIAKVPVRLMATVEKIKLPDKKIPIERHKIAGNISQTPYKNVPYLWSMTITDIPTTSPSI